MQLDVSSATAFEPPPLAVLCEPAGRRVAGVAPDARRGAKPNTSASTGMIEELPFQITSERSASVLDKARVANEISKRLRFLRIEAETDRNPFSDASLIDFQAFMRETGTRSRPSLFLNDNGNLRALWKNDRREQIGLQFLGEGNIQFVIFGQRRGTLGMARVAGIDAKDKILGHIKASGTEGLLFG
jgi:hypothetical protein